MRIPRDWNRLLLNATVLVGTLLPQVGLDRALAQAERTKQPAQNGQLNKSQPQKGLAKLDEATDLQLTAESIGDMEKVVGLCEESLKAGLDEENKKFARQLASSTLLKIAQQRAAALADRRQREGRWETVRDQALKDLDKARGFDDQNAAVHLLRARLLSLPGSDRAQAIEAADKAVSLLQDEKRELVAALLLRSGLRTDPEQQLADLNDAVEADAGETNALEARALYYLSRGEADKAIEDFSKLAEMEPDNPQMRFAYAMALVSANKLPEALEQATIIIEANPGLAGPYKLRAQVRKALGKPAEAIADLDQSLLIEPQDLESLLLRAELYEDLRDFDRARADVEQVLQLRPGLAVAILQRASIYSTQKRYDLALADLGKLLKQDPKNVQLRVQIAQLYLAGGWPRKAIELNSELLKEDSGNWIALRSRGDAFLAIGKHAEAIADFESAVKIVPDNGGILNNFAWVLATSPVDKLRDSKRAIEYGTRACEITQYKESHILSTLAAGYAEAGDFDTAIKWSTRSVELGEGESKAQLEKELESYKRKQPWREMQETVEKPDPPLLRDDLDL